MDNVVLLENVTAGYSSNAVLKNISAKFCAGKITVILGGSGCGKSTLLKTILRLRPAMSGYIEVLGKNINSLNENEYEELLKDIGVLFQNGALLNSLTLYENVIMPLEQHTSLPWEVMDRMVRLQLEKVGLGKDLFKLPGELSGGMRKRAALARSIILNPEILFCDEPSAGLDPITSAQLDNLLLEMKKQFNMSIIVVTHEISSIQRIADDIVFLEDGRCVFSGPLEDALKISFSVRDFFKAGENPREKAEAE